MRAAIVMLVLVIILAVSAKGCAEKERKLIVKQPPPPPKDTRAPRHPASPYQWTLSEKGLGPVKLGATREEVEAAIGEPFRVGANGHERCGAADWPGAPAGVTVVIGAGVVRRIEVNADAAGLAIEGGVTIGTDSIFAVGVFSTLGKPMHPSSRSGVVIVNLTPSLNPAAALAISFLDHKVWGYQLGYLHEIDNHNVCG